MTGFVYALFHVWPGLPFHSLTAISDTGGDYRLDQECLRGGEPSQRRNALPYTHYVGTTLDHSLIGHLAEFAAPFRFASDWVVNLDTHFLGGGRFWGSWEIADIGILVIFRRQGQILGTKLALMQSKRLYPDELEVPADVHAMDYALGLEGC